ncbi:OmpL47-type beta-barrel domain-containing protein [Paenibacillus enshidis]|uniref:OmpL47-type beta-barrel domain-containing protein n=1 Tax=Paenibacillus enshidis TaxID=1458439 RepID=A0ABV5AV96_9BACL
MNRVQDYYIPTQPHITLSPAAYTNGNVSVVIDGSIDNETAVKKYQYMLSGATSTGWTDYTGSLVLSNSGVTQITARALDYNDNTSPVSTANAYIDKTAPNAPSIAVDRSGWYSGNKVITIAHGQDSLSGVQKSQYQINGGGWIDYTGPFTVSERLTVGARTLDQVGNISSVTTLDTLIDKMAPAAPSISVDRNGWYSGNKVITITHGQDAVSGVQKSQYQLNGGSWTDYTGPFSVGERVTVGARTLDQAGNASPVSTLDTLIDKTAPGAPSVSADRSGWYSGNKVIMISHGQDNLSGVQKSQYQLNGGSWQDYTAPFTVSDRLTVGARTLDQAGNTSPVTTLDTLIDKASPSAPTITVDRSGWYNENKVITIAHGQDTVSGVQKSEYQINGGNWSEYKGPFTVSERVIVGARTLDQAGNASPVTTLDALIDKSAPEPPQISISGGSSWQSGTKTVTITDGNDQGGSGARETEYRINDGDWTKYTGPFVVKEEEQTIYARTWDNAENVSSEASAESNIDKTAPTTPIIHMNPDGDTSENIEISITPGSDTLSGVKITEYKVGAATGWQKYTGPFVVSEEGEHQVFSRSTDNAGNISTIVNGTAVIDRTPPTPPIISLSTDDYTAGDVQFTISGSADARAFGYEYKIGNGSYTSGDQGEVSEDGLTVITARAVDAAGNISDETSTTVRIDKKDPVIHMSPSQREWSADSITATIQYQDDGSGINPDRRYYKVTSTPDEPNSWELANSNSFQVNIMEEGTWYIHAKVEDYVGNSEVINSSALRLQLPPEVPELSVQSVGLQEAALQWTLPGGNTYIDGYEYTLRNLTNGKTMNVTYPGDRVIDHSLSPGTNYEYELTVRNHVGEAVSHSVRLLTLPAAPASLALHPVDRDAGQLTASFDPVQSADSYRIVAYEMPQQQEVYNQTVTDSVYQSVLNLQPGTVYNVAVSAINATGEGPAMIQSILSLPDTPNGFKSVSIGENRVDLTWHSVTTATYYTLDRDGMSVTESVYEDYYSDTGLSAGIRYDYRLAAINSTGPGAYSHLDVLTLPGVVNGLTVIEARRNEMDIAWNRVRGASGYNIFVNGVDEHRVGADVLKTAITDLPAGSPAKITIQAFNSSGMGVTNDVYGLTLPEQPGEVTVSDIQEQSAVLSWTPIHGATKYNIDIDGRNYTTADTQLRVAGLSAGTNYAFTLTAGNTSGYGDRRNGELLTLPGQVVGFTAQQPKDRSFMLSWEPVKSATNYIVYQGKDEIGTTSEASIQVQDLQPGQDYAYQVIAVNGTGKGAPGTFHWRTYPSSIQQGDAWITEVTSNSAAAEWLEVPGADYYRVYLDGELLGDTTALRFNFTGFESSELHTAVIEPVNSSGASSRFELPFETLPDSEFTAEAEPTSSTSITVTVGNTKPNDTIVIAHKGEVIYKGKNPVFVWEHLKSGTEYEIEVWTENRNGDKSESQIITERTYSSSKPSVPPAIDNVIDVPAVTPPADVPTSAPVVDQPVDNGSGKPKFTDIDRSFNKGKIQALADDGILKGTSDTTFEPFREVTRAEFASMMVRALQLPTEPDTALTFEDIQADGWYIPELQTAIKHVVARGFSESVFAPDMRISREQASKMVGNVARTIQETDNFGGFYTDESGIAEWAKTEVLGLTKESLLQGYPDGSFRPKQSVTRQEAAEMIFNLLNKH